MKAENEIKKGISEIVGVFTDPIIVFPGGWGDTLPGWLKDAITLERLMMNGKALHGEEMMGSDAEACAYLYTAGLTAPFDYDWTQIYLYITRKVYKAHKGGDVPEDIQVQSLNQEQENDLKRLKEWLYRQRTRIRLERDRAERRQEREEQAERHREEQPALFVF